MAFDAPDVSDSQCDINPGYIVSRSCKRSDKTGTRIGCTANYLHVLTVAQIDDTDPQSVGIRVLFRADDLCRVEPAKRFRGISDVLDLEAQHGQAGREFVERCVGFQVLFHRRCC